MDESFQNLSSYLDDPCNCTLKSRLSVDVFEYLECCFAPRRIDDAILLPITVVYVIIFVCGLVGNISVCVVIVKNSHMHTATNFYLFSLAVSDLTLLIFGLPNELHTYWQQYPWIFGEGFCKIRGMVAEMTSYASVLTIVAFSLERYLAICHPLFAYTMAGLGRAVRIIALIWLASLLCSVPFAVYSTINYRPFPESTEDIPESAFCGMMDAPMLLYEVSTIVFFILPMGILSILYALMGTRIRQTTMVEKEFANSVHNGCTRGRSMASKRNITRMLTAVVIGFFVCWAPFHAQRLLYLYGMGVIQFELFQSLNEGIFYVAGCFYFMSAVINPILYNLMSERYRSAFKETVCGSRERMSRTVLLSQAENGNCSAPGGSYRKESGKWTRETNTSITRMTRQSSTDSSRSKNRSLHDSFLRFFQRSIKEQPLCLPTAAKETSSVCNPLLRKPSDEVWDELTATRKNGENMKSMIKAGCNPSCLGVLNRGNVDHRRSATQSSQETQETDSEKSIEVVIKRVVTFPEATDEQSATETGV